MAKEKDESSSSKRVAGATLGEESGGNNAALEARDEEVRKKMKFQKSMPEVYNLRAGKDND